MNTKIRNDYLRLSYDNSNNFGLIINKPSIVIDNLQKYYHKTLVLDIPSLKFYYGKTYLIIGENGSGKSTLIKSIIGLIKFNGRIEKNNEIIGYLPERFPEISYIKSKTFLDCLIINKEEKSALDDLASFFDLDLNKSVTSLSKGNLQKLMIIQSFINKANIIILDEPMNGLDIENQRKLVFLLKQLKNENRTIIITTHYPKYYEEIYDNVVYLKNGRLDEN